MSKIERYVKIEPPEHGLHAEIKCVRDIKCPFCDGHGKSTWWGIGDRDTVVKTCEECAGTGRLKAKVTIEWLPDCE